ncbi:Rieske (2Fe-2S) protein [Sphaerotilus microaerophilus]|jgi:nitrite reductase/ring-hydroxylating ferredoxin subunit|uniref:Rieske iron-sulfur protein n=1 Tax=Sphaerotilus microaerophilus TaxID=2914710 RepID=A0ABN6PKF7_9BURK|nr:Rieske 2Fe-2S domain-containing protein [Sphaerotilus sp. FB-5]BDI04300.1 Rieske iron-sulfur protein [Sphaerotilus sp. FB-5]
MSDSSALDANAPAVPLCASADLGEAGDAHVFDLTEYGQPVRGFVLRYEGRVVGYLNRCAHVPAEMDWQPGKFLDDSGRWILCSIHGAAYDPASGHCVAGPCAGRSLKPLRVGERDGQVHWYPDKHLQPAAAD